jgi:hypothetical protein
VEVFLYFGLIVASVGYIWLFNLAFSDDLEGGVRVLRRFVLLSFAINRWPETRMPLLMIAVGLIIAGIGVLGLKLGW